VVDNGYHDLASRPTAAASAAHSVEVGVEKAKVLGIFGDRDRNTGGSCWRQTRFIEVP
jgi:hypothetical protein